MTDDEIEKHHEQMAQIASLNPAVVEPSGHPILDDDRQRQYWDKYSQLYRVSTSVPSLSSRCYLLNSPQRIRRRSSFVFQEVTSTTQSPGRLIP